MPLPIKQGKTKQQWVEEATKLLIEKEGKDPKQAYAIANSMWTQKDIMVAMHDYSGQITKAIEMNGVLKIPVIIAKEMVQLYHINELPQYVRDAIPDGVKVVKIFKPYEELKKMVEHAVPVPYGEPHFEETFHKGNQDSELVKAIDRIRKIDDKFEMKYLDETKIYGWVKDYIADDERRLIKSNLYIKMKDAPTEVVERFQRGDVIDVSIGFSAYFDEGGTYKDEEYLFAQRGMILGHLGGLPHDTGKCPRGICGTNMDKVMFKDGEILGLTTARFFPKVFFDMINLGKSEQIELPQQNTFKKEQHGNSPSSLNLVRKKNMTPEEILKQLQDQLTAKNEELAKVQASLNDKKAADWEAKAKDYETKYTAADAMAKDLQGKLTTATDKLGKLEDTQKKDIRSKIERLKLPQYPAEKLDKMCLHDMSVAWEALGAIADQALSQNGLPKPAGESKEQVDQPTLPSFYTGNDAVMDEKKEDK